MKTLGIVPVRRASRGAYAKIGRKLGGKSLLEWVVRRLTDCQRLDGVAVVLGASEHDRRIGQLVPPDVPALVSSQGDRLARSVEAAGRFDARAVVCVAPDNPFIDPVLIDRLVSTADLHPNCDYIGYCRADGRPAILSQVGVLAEWCSTDALRRANLAAGRAADRENVTSYLYAHPELFTVRLIPLPPELDRDDVRLKIDHEEDWEHAQVIYEALGAEEWDWQRIADLLDHQPALRNRMAALNRGVSRAASR
jgi:spore coat polysaccharide biosynthesis protein SpsF (cytidylyltransferase family)